MIRTKIIYQPIFIDEMRIRRPGTKNEWNWVSSNVMVTNYKPEENEIEIIGINYDITELKETTGAADAGHPA